MAEIQTFLPGCAPRGQRENESVPPPARVAPPPIRVPKRDDPEARAAVAGRVRGAVLDFFELRVRNAAPAFHMAELTEYVRGRVPTAPDSAGRIMRLLAQEGVLSYELVSRAKSLYQVTTDRTSEGTR
jgi:hypothetical protein